MKYLSSGVILFFALIGFFDVLDAAHVGFFAVMGWQTGPTDTLAFFVFAGLACFWAGSMRGYKRGEREGGHSVWQNIMENESVSQLAEEQIALRRKLGLDGFRGYVATHPDAWRAGANKAWPPLAKKDVAA
jgi:hypothetical protein